MKPSKSCISITVRKTGADPCSLSTSPSRRWRPHGSAQNLHIKVILQLLVQLPREDRIAVVDQELITMVIGNGFPALLQCPVWRGMRGHVVVQNTAAADFHHEKDQQHLEPDRHSDQKDVRYSSSGKPLRPSQFPICIVHGNDPAYPSSQEYVFIYDISQGAPVQRQVVTIRNTEANLRMSVWSTTFSTIFRQRLLGRCLHHVQLRGWLAADSC